MKKVRVTTKRQLASASAKKKLRSDLRKMESARSKSPIRRKNAPVKRTGERIGGAAGKFAAGFLPPPLNGLLSPVAESLGEKLGGGIQTLLGMGDYAMGKVQKNHMAEKYLDGTIVLGQGVQVPKMYSDGDDFIVEHREFISEVVGAGVPGAFKIDRYRLQPGFYGTFPWAAAIARRFFQYDLEGFVAEFSSSTGLISTAATPNIGVVAMVTEYDASQPNPFSTMREVLNTVFATKAKPTESFLHAVECARGENPTDILLTRRDLNVGQNNPQAYDLGIFTISSEGLPTANQILGQLFFSYKIRFKKAMLQDLLGDPRTSTFLSDGTSASGKLTPLDTPMDPSIRNQVPAVIVDDTITFGKDLRSGVFKISILMGFSSTATGPGFTSVEPTNATIGSMMVQYNDTPASVAAFTGYFSNVNVYVPGTAVSTNTNYAEFVVRINKSQASLQISYSANRANTWCLVTIEEVDVNLTTFSLNLTSAGWTGTHLPAPPGPGPHTIERDFNGNFQGWKPLKKFLKTAGPDPSVPPKAEEKIISLSDLRALLPTGNQFDSETREKASILAKVFDDVDQYNRDNEVLGYGQPEQKTHEAFFATPAGLIASCKERIAVLERVLSPIDTLCPQCRNPDLISVSEEQKHLLCEIHLCILEEKLDPPTVLEDDSEDEVDECTNCKEVRERCEREGEPVPLDTCPAGDPDWLINKRTLARLIKNDLFEVAFKLMSTIRMYAPEDWERYRPEREQLKQAMKDHFVATLKSNLDGRNPRPLSS
jgi:hypothetical protein